MTSRGRIAACRPVAWALLVIVFGTAFAPAAWGQSVLRKVPQAGQLAFEFESDRVGSADTLRSHRTVVTSTLSIPITGTLVDEDLARFFITVSPERRRIWSASLATSGHVETRSVGYEGLVQLLTGTPFPVELQGLRRSGAIRGDFGQYRDTDDESRSATIRWKHLVLPLSASLKRQLRRDAWRSPMNQRPFLRQEQIDAVSWGLRNSKTVFLFERTTYAELLRNTRLDTKVATFSNAHRWGKGSTLISTGQAITRAEADKSTSSNWSQSTRIEHTPALRSELSYHLRASHAAGRSSNADAEAMAILLRPTPSLQVGLRSMRALDRFSGGSQRVIAAGPVIAIRRSFGEWFSLSANAALAREWRDRTLTDRHAFVVDEAYVVDSSRQITIRRPSVESASLEVRSGDHSLLHVLGVDYQVFAGELGTQLIIIPGGRIAIGDTLLVAYTFLLPERQPASGATTEYGATISSGPLSLFHRRAVRPNFSSGTGFLASEMVDEATGAHFLIDRGARSLALAAEERRQEAWGISAVLREGRASLTARSAAGAVAGLSMSITRYDAEARQTQSAALVGSLSWFISRALRVSAELRGWSWRATGAPHEELLGGSLGGELRIGLMDLALRGEAYGRDIGGVPARESRVTARFSRRY